MTNLTSLMFGQGLYSSEVLARHLGADWEQQYGMTGHADMAETAANLHVRGDLVKPAWMAGSDHRCPGFGPSLHRDS